MTLELDQESASANSAANTATITALDLFAGTGWGVACQRLNIQEFGVELMPEAIATREANGMNTIYNDVWEGLERPKLAYELLIASPPCQTFSMAGNGSGRKALDDVIEAITTGAYRDPAKLRQFGEDHDPRTALVLTPLAHVARDMPMFVALEQVPTVLPVWEACAEVMRGWGYSVKVANLHAEQYGVPQTRKRAILVARRDGIEVQLPTPTHSKYHSTNPTKMDEGVLPWVSMAEALGRILRDGEHFVPNHKRVNQARRPLDHPAATITAGHDTGNRGFVLDGELTVATPDEVAALQSYPTGRGLTNKPSPTIVGTSGNGGGQPLMKFKERCTSNPGWVGSQAPLSVEEASALQSYPVGRGLIDRPSPTVIAGGAATGGSESIAYLRRYTEAPGWVGAKGRLEAEEASTLQTYERPFVWCGSKTKQFLQIGNAVPPRLAEAILTALTAPGETK